MGTNDIKLQSLSGTQTTYENVTDLHFIGNYNRYQPVVSFTLAPETDNYGDLCLPVQGGSGCMPSYYGGGSIPSGGTAYYYLTANKKYYLSTVGHNKIKFYNKLYLIEFDEDDTHYGIEDVSCGMPKSYIILNNGDTRTGLASFCGVTSGSSYKDTPKFADTEIALTVGCDNNGPYIYSGSMLAVGTTKTGGTAVIALLLDNKHYVIFANIGDTATLLNNNKTAISYNSSGTSFTHPILCTSGPVPDPFTNSFRGGDYTELRCLLANDRDDAYGIFLYTILNKAGTGLRLSPAFCKLETSSSYGCILGGPNYTAPLLGVLKFKI